MTDKGLFGAAPLWEEQAQALVVRSSAGPWGYRTSGMRWQSSGFWGDQSKMSVLLDRGLQHGFVNLRQLSSGYR